MKKRSKFDEEPRFCAPEPQKPIEISTVVNEHIVFDVNAEGHDGVELKLSDLYVPDGVSIQDLIFVFDHTGYDDVDCRIVSRTTHSVPNKNYDALLAKYEVAHKKWEEERDKFNKALKAWKARQKKEKDAELKASLDAAEALLKKHGRL